MNYAELFRVTLPETALEIAALLVLVVDLGFLRKSSLHMRVAVSLYLGRAWMRRRNHDDSAPGTRRPDAAPRCTILLAAGGSAAVAQIGILALTVLTLLLLIRSRLHAPCGRVCCRRADGGGGRHADFRSAGSACDLYRSRACSAWASTSSLHLPRSRRRAPRRP